MKMRHYENLHIPLWLIKDTCWMMEWKEVGVVMIVPTLLVSVVLLIISVKKKEDELWINLAITFWIIANSYWMITEFTDHLELKTYALFPFILGMVCVAYFYLIPKIRLLKNK